MIGTTVKRRSSRPFWIVAGVGLVVVVLGVVFASRFGVDPQLTPSPLIGQPLPDLTLPYLEFDEDFSFADLEGDVAVINFWASWCLACRVEHQALLDAAAAYQDLGVTFVGVLIQDRADFGLDFLSELGRGEPYVYLDDQGSRASLEFGVLGVPETFFVDRDGTIVGKVSGPVNTPLITATLDAILLGRADDLGVVKTGEVENR
ncbi:MAG: redoxin domain-containing protein [Actinomycetota bacterium]|nr:redoxin domain-containing protein [Actinomycetota bacterium]